MEISRRRSQLTLLNLIKCLMKYFCAAETQTCRYNHVKTISLLRSNSKTNPFTFPLHLSTISNNYFKRIALVSVLFIWIASQLTVDCNCEGQ